MQNIWQFKKNSVPLHPQIRDHLFCMPFNALKGSESKERW